MIDLSQFEEKIYSQNGEDGILQKLFEVINLTDKFYVEFGVADGLECNTRYLDTKGWKGIKFDVGNHDPGRNIFDEYFTTKYAVSIFRHYKIPFLFDLLSIDIDRNDWYIWRTLGKVYKPRVLIIEHNSTHSPDEDKVVFYEGETSWDGTNYFGGSILAFYNLGRHLGYSLVYADSTGTNLFFVRDDVIQNIDQEFLNINNPVLIYNEPTYGFDGNFGHSLDLQKRKYVTSRDLISSAC